MLALLGLSFANLDHSLFTLVLTQVKASFGWTDTERGWYLCATFVLAGFIVSQIGVLADRIGRKRTLLASMLLTPLFVVAMAFAPGTCSLLALRTLGFATAGAQSPLTGTLVLEEAPLRYRGLLSGILQIAYPIGWAAAALVFVPLVWDAESQPQAWRNVFWLALLGLPVAAAFYWWLREPPVWVAARHQGGAESPTTAQLFQPKFRSRTLILFSGQFLHVFAYGSTLLLVAWFQEARGWSFTVASSIVGWSYLIGAFGYVLAAVAGEFWLRRRTVILLWIWLGAAAFVYALWFAESVDATRIAFCVTTFFFFGATAVIFTFTAESYPAYIRATAVSFAGSLAVNLGIAFGPLATSVLVPQVGWQWAFTAAGLLPLVLAGVAYSAARHPEPQE
ncbi:MAG: MFS transporter [Steroidobacteraceae bacterium]|nr:MFS transporter [Steroidobacteraceae bacterium]MDW8260301.1 MFS transporter [Gammaproteobacteria bacterium]